jgi:hypothetical protein
MLQVKFYTGLLSSVRPFMPGGYIATCENQAELRYHRKHSL